MVFISLQLLIFITVSSFIQYQNPFLKLIWHILLAFIQISITTLSFIFGDAFLTQPIISIMFELPPKIQHLYHQL
jgi:hypothetical protein